jgi:plasmid stabilization system protein ParE
MPRVEWNAAALADLDGLESFLYSRNPRAANEAIAAIRAATRLLSDFPDAGPIYRDGYRQLSVRFSNSGYLVLYRPNEHAVEIVRIRHMREDQY